jgi:comEA protein
MSPAPHAGRTYADQRLPMELNRVERRALFLASALVAVGAAARVGLGPGEATFAWRPRTGPSPSLDSTQARVDREVARAARIATPLAPGERIDPNLAPTEELQRLPGIGPRKAAAIIDSRRADPFRSVDDLMRVRGLGPATVERLRPYLDLRQRVVEALPPRGSTAMRPGAGDGSSHAGPTDRVDLNRATVADLVRLPGLGPKRAAAIVENRERVGPFRSVDEVTRVPGIGPAILERLRPRLSVR